MRISTRIGAALLCSASTFISTLASASVIEIVGTGINDEVAVQNALDSNPEGTMFHLVGSFSFSEPVYVEKSNVAIYGDYEDSNEDGRANEGDTWSTVIVGPSREGFIISGKGNTRVPEGISNVRFSGLHMIGMFESVYSPVFEFPDTAAECGQDDTTKIERLLLEKNHFEETNLILLGNTHRSSVIDNFMTTSTFRLAQFGWLSQLAGCDLYADKYGKGNSLEDNTVIGPLSFFLASQEGLSVSGNTIVTPGSATHGSMALVFTKGAIVTDNYIEVGSAIDTYGIDVLSRNTFFPGAPFEYTEKLTISNNTVVGSRLPIAVFGGIEKSSITGNTVSGTDSSAGIAIFDNLDGIFGPGQLNNSSSNLRISNNSIDATGMLAGVLLNGDTSGVEIVNNTFPSVGAIVADIWLLGEDFLGLLPMCPAHDNKVITSNVSTTVLDQYYPAPGCEGRRNKHLGKLKYLKKDMSKLSPKVQAKMAELREMKIDRAVGRPQY